MTSPNIAEQAQRAGDVGVASRPLATAVDLFCGAGGLTRGLLDAGIPVAAGYDIDKACQFPYEHNNVGAKFHLKDVGKLTGAELAAHYPPGHVRILVGCAPCQTFSKYTQRAKGGSDPRWALLREFGRLVQELRPEIVSMENVPELQRHSVFTDFLSTLSQEGYFFEAQPERRILHCADFGVPQTRRRLVLIASRFGPIGSPPPTHSAASHRTVKDALAGQPPLAAGEQSGSDPLHRSCELSPTNLLRIAASRPGGTWRDWPREIVASCHRRSTGKTYPSVYGRMEWDKPSPTMTTQFFGFGNGRFGHPDQNRAISLREGALLQSFPPGYSFGEPGKSIQFSTIGRMIGNAVPVRLAQAIGGVIRAHVASTGVHKATAPWQ